MSTSAYYQAEAARCRALAEKSPSSDMATRWREMAREYEKLSESMQAIPRVTQPVHAPMQQQPLQQQQARQKTDES